MQKHKSTKPFVHQDQHVVIPGLFFIVLRGLRGRGRGVVRLGFVNIV